MDIVISHKSALRYWRAFNGNPQALFFVRRPAPMDHPPSLTADLLAELAACGLVPTRDHPLDLLFSSASARSQALCIRAHYISRPLPAGALVRLSDHILIASPDLTFVQISTEYPFRGLIMVGCELCGSYRLIDGRGQKLPKPQKRTAPTTASSLRDMAAKMGLGKHAAAVQAARFVFDNAESPMEAKTALLLSLPPRLGGYGLPRPTLNPKFVLSDAAFAIYPCNPCRLDLFWPEVHLDVEYDGGTHEGEGHAGSVARAMALTHDGIEVFTITKEQLYDPRAFATMAHLVAERLRKRIRIRCKGFPMRQAQLRKELHLQRGSFLSAWAD